MLFSSITVHKVHSPSFQTFIRRDGGGFREWVCERDRGRGGGGEGCAVPTTSEVKV